MAAGILYDMRMLGAIVQSYRSAMLLIIGLLCLSVAQAEASPFGQGVFGADVPFGSATSIAVNLGGDVSLDLAPTGPNTLGASSSHTLTVTSTDVVGYRLYSRALTSSSLVNGAYSIPASANGSPAALADNTWGYNTDGSANFVGISTQNALIKDVDGPYKNGDDTIVTYGVVANTTKEAGNYTTSVVYTVVAKNQ